MGQGGTNGPVKIYAGETMYLTNKDKERQKVYE